MAAVGKGYFLADHILVVVEAVDKGCFLADRILVAVVDMAQAADTAAAPGMSARTDLVVDTADKVGRAVSQ